MSTRRTQSLPPHMAYEKPPRGRCIAAICFTWKVITCVVSHVTLVLLVVSYCVGGAYLFQHLEKPHEIEVKKGIQHMRYMLTDKIWKFSDNVSVLSEHDWIASVKMDLANFEKDLLTAMKTDGWDGDEDPTKSQWTFAGSLFYSIIVITTIGYGHISPRTDWGKVTTIFYAIIGIPLMLLCLSNIGDVMATSFRFIYWRVCCYICTRSERKSRQRSRQRSQRRYRSQPAPPIRRSIRMTQRSGNDSGFGPSVGMSHAYSDPELGTMGRGGHDRYDYEFRGGSGHRRRNRDRDHHHHHNHNHNHYPPPPPPPPMDGRRRGGHSSHYEDDPYAYDDEYGGQGPGYTQTLNRHSRMSSRQRNRDRMRDRHTVERERYLSRSKQHFGSMEELSVPLPSHKRTLSVRSVRSPNMRRDESNRTSRESRDSREIPIPDNRNNNNNNNNSNNNDARESREIRELNRLNARGRSVPSGSSRNRAKSADPRAAPGYEPVNEELVRKTPIISNRYAIDGMEEEQETHHHHHHHHHHQHHPHHQRISKADVQRSQSMPRSAAGGGPPSHRGSNHSQRSNRSHIEPMERDRGGGSRRNSFTRQNSAPHQSRYGNQLELPELNAHSKRGRSPRRDDFEEEVDDYYYDDRDLEAGGDGGDYEDYPVQTTPRSREPRRQRRERSERLPPSPRIMSPMGFAVKRQVRCRPSYDYDDDSMYGDDWNEYGDMAPKDRPVPIWLCVFLVIGYILGGAALFAYWESWSFLDSAYFCFITLTTIGFGDFVPAKGVKDESQQSIAYCSLYLLFGIALLAMSFNLVQEEFIANVKQVAKRLGILKDDDEDDE